MQHCTSDRFRRVGKTDLQEELSVSAGLSRTLNLAGVELTALSALQDPVDGGEERGVEKVLTD